MSETRFTERAQAALRLAQECSAELGHGYVGSEHLLLGLAREGKGVAAKVLQSAGLEPESLKAAIARMVGVGAPGGAPSQGLTPRCKKIIELSLTEAARLGHHYVGTEHLLLGILREGDGVAVRVLSGTGVEPGGSTPTWWPPWGRGISLPLPGRRQDTGAGVRRRHQAAGPVLPRSHPAGRRGHAGPGGGPGQGDQPGHPDPLPPPEEQSRPHRRARRGQDRRGRGAGPPHGGRGCARRAALQASAFPGPVLHGGGHQVPGRV
ncbi:MAG: Clp protease N-terminal domain-containing protein [Flavonifractor plautii]